WQTAGRNCSISTANCVDLMDRCGQVTSLSEKEHSAARAASLLTERHSYVLLRVCRCEESQGQKYESLLNNLSKSHPELAGNRRFFCTSMGLHVNTQPDICLTCSRYPEQNVKPQQGT
uniref:Uncharacterized protein n=1 Tax=Gadus morhua TaxID=8049 RepID=A0A8C5C7X8_GADMO